MLVKYFKKLSYGEFVDVDGGYVAWSLAFVVRVSHLIYDDVAFKLVDDLLGEASGYVGKGCQLGHGVRCSAFFIALADERGDEQCREIVESVADVFHIVVETIELEVLAVVGELNAKEDDAPEDVEEEEQQGDDGERAVDGVVGRDVHLHVDVEVEERLKNEASDEARDDGVAETYLGVGEEDEHAGEDEPRQHVGRSLDEEADEGAEEELALQVGIDGGHENAPAGDADDEERQQEEHGEVVGNLAEDGALLLYAPDCVHVLLNVAGKGDDRPEEHNEADADEDAAVGVLEVGVDEGHDGVEGVAAYGNAVTEERLQEVGEPETAGNGEEQRQDGHERKGRGVGEGLGLHGDAVAGILTGGDDGDLEHVIALALLAVHLRVLYSPDFLAEECLYCFDFFRHGVSY